MFLKNILKKKETPENNFQIRCLGYVKIPSKPTKLPVFHKEEIMDYLRSYGNNLSEKELIQQYDSLYGSNPNVLVLEDTPLSADDIINTESEGKKLLNELDTLIKKLEKEEDEDN